MTKKPAKLEMIASVTAQFCENYGLKQGFNHVDFDHFIEEATPHTFLRQREWQDNCDNGTDGEGKELPRGDKYGRQLLPYVPVNQRGADGQKRMCTYRRLKGNGEARMVGDVSAGFGGHADKADVLAPTVHPQGLVVDNLGSIPDWAATIMANAHREVGKEELRFWATLNGEMYLVNPTTHPEFFQWKFEGLIIDNSNDVGWLHLGIVVSCLVHPDIRITSGEADKLELMAPMTPRELLDADLPREPWTTILAEYLADEPYRADPLV